MSHDTEIKDLQEDMKRFMTYHQISSINEVLQMKPVDLLRMEGFGYRLLNAYFFKSIISETLADLAIQ